MVISIKKELGEDIAIAFVTKAINEVCMMTNTNMSPDVQVMISASIINDYWTLRIEEVFDALAYGCKKKYGDINFKGVDYPTIMSWLQQYEIDRSILLENKHLDKKAQTAGDTTRMTQPTPFDGVLEKMEMLRSGLDQNRIELLRLKKENAELKENNQPSN